MNDFDKPAFSQFLFPGENDDATSDVIERSNLKRQPSMDEAMAVYNSIVKPQSADATSAPAPGPGGNPAAGGDADLDSLHFTPGGKPGSASRTVIGDIGKGLVETPRALARGVEGGLEAAVNSAVDVVDFLGNQMGAGDIDEQAVHTWVKSQGLNLDPPESVTGNLVEGMAQFLTGFVTAGKALKTGNWAVKGIVSDAAFFDAQDQTLSNLIQQYPALQNPISEMLATDPNDPDWMNRAKRAFEGLALGGATEAFGRAVKAVAQYHNAKAMKGASPAGLDDAAKRAAVESEITKRDFMLLGDPDAPVIQARAMEKPGTVVRKAVKDLPEDETKEVLDGLNFAAIKSVDDIDGAVKVIRHSVEKLKNVPDAITKAADARAAGINEARRGVRTHEMTEAAAAQKKAMDIIIERRARNGAGALNAEEIHAVQTFRDAAARKLIQLSREAAKNPSDANLYMQKRMEAVYYAASREFEGARAEAGRAMDALKIPSKINRLRSQEVRRLLDEMGGVELQRERAERLAQLTDDKLALELDGVIKGTFWARTRDSLLKGWINGLLSGPQTHLVNMMSNTSVIAGQVAERAVAGQLSKAFGTEGGVATGEALSQIFGLVEGFKDAFRLGGIGRKTGTVWHQIRTGESTFGGSKIDLKETGIHGAAKWGVASETLPGKLLDGVSSVVGFPGKALQVEDELFKTLGYRMELRARALRQASQEVAQGKLQSKAIKSRVQQLVDQPPEDLRLGAIDQAVMQTFQNKTGPIGNWLTAGVTRMPVLRIVLPFVRTPANIFRYAAERSPIAPLLSQWRADIAAGGARRDLALTRMSLGTAGMLAFADMAQSGQIVGRAPEQPGDRAAFLRSGKKEYSVKFGDKWVQLSRLDPVAMTMFTAADLVQTFASADFDESLEEDAGRAWAAAITATASNMMSKTYLSGVSSLMRAMVHGDAAAESYVARLAGSLVPAGSAQLTRAIDPTLRYAETLTDGIMRRVPWGSKDLPPQKDLWGRNIPLTSNHGFAYDFLSPFQISKEDPEPIDAELQKIGYAPSMPSKTVRITVEDDISGRSVPISLRSNGKAYLRYVALAGNEAKHPVWGLGAKDLLNEIVEGKHALSDLYELAGETGGDGGREDFIRDMISDFRKLARERLIDEFPELQRQAAARLRMEDQGG